MTVMSIEQLLKVNRQSNSNDCWVPTKKGVQIAKHIRDLESEGRKRIETSTPLCPVHNVLGKYIKTEGTFQKAISVFKCPQNHEFNIPD